MKKAGRTISGVGLGLGVTAVGFATWGVLSTGTASASTVDRAAPTPTGTVPATVPATAPATAPATVNPTTTPTVAPTTPTITPTTAPATVPATTVPTAPPATGGGGTAGLQDAVLFGIGGAALLVGSGSIVYRLKGNKHR
jgi:hypothetical protein